MFRGSEPNNTESTLACRGQTSGLDRAIAQPHLEDGTSATTRGAAGLWGLQLAKAVTGISAVALLLLWASTSLSRAALPWRMCPEEDYTSAHVSIVLNHFSNKAEPGEVPKRLEAMPTYYLLTALVSRVLQGYMAPRLLAFSMMVISLYALYAIVRLITQTHLYSLLAAAMAVHLSPFMGGRSAAAIPSLMAMGLVALAVLSVCRRPGKAAAVAVGLLSAATITTDLLFLPLVLCLLICLWVDAISIGGLATLVTVTMSVAVCGVTAIATDGWFSMVSVRSILAAPLVLRRGISFLPEDLLRTMPLLSVFTLCFAFRAFRSLKNCRLNRLDLCVLAVLFGSILTSGCTRLRAGAARPDSMTAVTWTFSLASAVWLGQLVRIPRRHRLAIRIVFLSSAALMVVSGAIQMKGPSDTDYEHGSKVDRIIAGLPGRVLVPNHFGLMARRDAQHVAEHAWIGRTAGRERIPECQDIPPGIREDIANQAFDAVVLDARDRFWISMLEGRYRLTRTINAPDSLRYLGFDAMNVYVPLHAGRQTGKER